MTGFGLTPLLCPQGVIPFSLVSSIVVLTPSASSSCAHTVHPSVDHYPDLQYFVLLTVGTSLPAAFSVVPVEQQFRAEERRGSDDDEEGEGSSVELERSPTERVKRLPVTNSNR